jgi:hypothetical protein
MLTSAQDTHEAYRKITVKLPEPFTPTWSRIGGVHVDGATLTIDPSRYFFRYDNPSWLLCDWDRVRGGLLDAVESPLSSIEQQTLDFIRAYGQRTTDAAMVISVAYQVYAFLFREEHLADPGLSHITRRHLRMLQQCAILMALNRVEMDGSISNVGPAWFFPVTAKVVYDLDDEQTALVDELYHGTFFNENRRMESIKAHAALGGRLVHGCQSRPDMSGGCVVPYGADIVRFREELNEFKHEWMKSIRSGHAALRA